LKVFLIVYIHRPTIAASFDFNKYGRIRGRWYYSDKRYWIYLCVSYNFPNKKFIFVNMFSYIITLTIGITWIWNGKCLRFCHLSLDHYLEPDCFYPTFSTWTLIDPQLNENKFLTTVLSDLVYCSFCRPYDCSCIIAHTLTYIQNSLSHKLHPSYLKTVK
jgi:hypothetical protein